MNDILISQLADLMKCPLANAEQSKLLKLPLAGVSVDSRLIEPKQVFFALKGARVDGHASLAEAASKGAIAAVVNQNYSGEDFGLPLLRVEDGLQALQKLAQTILAQRSSKIVAITGSVGKTTTKDFTTALLRQKYCVASSPGNSNSKIGLPLAILNHTTGKEDFLVLEMGMTFPGEISDLIQIAPPHIAVITSVALVHAENFSSLEEIAFAKGEILGHPKTALGIIAREIEAYDLIKTIGSCRKLSFSTASRQADYYLEGTAKQFKVRCFGEDNISLPSLALAGKHNRHNLLAAVAVARSLQISWEEITQAIPLLALPERRLQTVEKSGIVFINDSYNASSVSVKAALAALPRPKAGGKRIAVIGEMLELGKFSERCHRDVGETALQKVDHLLCLGKECSPMQEIWKQSDKEASLFNTLSELIVALKKLVGAGDVVLLKGSRSKELWKVLDGFDE